MVVFILPLGSFFTPLLANHSCCCLDKANPVPQCRKYFLKLYIFEIIIKIFLTGQFSDRPWLSIFAHLPISGSRLTKFVSLIAIVKKTFRLRKVLLLQALMPPSFYLERKYDKRYILH
jgi:hypothetical protein